jgi:cupin 2 domain-containing protein
MPTNLFTDLPRDPPEELFTALVQAPRVRIERIVSHGHKSPDGVWYDQLTSEWVLVLQGAAKIEFADRTVEMGPGDYLDIPAHRKHRVAWTTPDEHTIWLAVHYGGVARITVPGTCAPYIFPQLPLIAGTRPSVCIGLLIAGLELGSDPDTWRFTPTPVSVSFFREVEFYDFANNRWLAIDLGELACRN